MRAPARAAARWGVVSAERSAAVIVTGIVLGLALGGALAYALEGIWGSIALVAVVLAAPLLAIGLTGNGDLLQPVFIVNAAYFLYFVLAPAADRLTRNDYFFGMYVTPLVPYGSVLAAAGFAAMLVGYWSAMGDRLAAIPQAPPDPRASAPAAVRFGLVLAAVSAALFAMYVTSSGYTWTVLFTLGQLGYTPDQAGQLGADSPLQNYLYNAVNMLTPAFMILYAFSRRGRPLLWLGYLAVLVIYVSIGFRFRVLIFVLAPVVYRFLRAGRRPTLKHVAAFGLLGFGIVGGLGALRQSYWGGLNTDAFSWNNSLKAFSASVAIYQPFLAVVDAFPARHDYLMGQSYAYLLYHPIPRALWPAKPRVPMQEIVYSAFGSEAPIRSGVAYPNLGEFYANFGLAGILVGMLLFGVLIRSLYRYLERHEDNDWARILFAVALPFLIEVVSRGNFVQIVQETVFFLGPIWLGGRYAALRVRRAAALAAGGAGP